MKTCRAGAEGGVGRRREAGRRGGAVDSVAGLGAGRLSITEVAEGSYQHKQPPEIVGSGYAVKTLEATLWAFHDARDFREAVLKAVNLGDDSDTTGAVCGQFAGTHWDERGIPAELLEGLARKDMIEGVFEKLIR